MQGELVMAIRGHDAGTIYWVMRYDEKGLCLVDGKKRCLSNPKYKNPKHVIWLGDYKAECLIKWNEFIYEQQETLAHKLPLRDEDIAYAIRQIKKEIQNKEQATDMWR